jgi:hypothetical protein
MMARVVMLGFVCCVIGLGCARTEEIDSASPEAEQKMQESLQKTEEIEKARLEQLRAEEKGEQP